jgi:hypothetical protein
MTAAAFDSHGMVTADPVLSTTTVRGPRRGEQPGGDREPPPGPGPYW